MMCDMRCCMPQHFRFDMDSSASVVSGGLDGPAAGEGGFTTPSVSPSCYIPQQPGNPYYPSSGGGSPQSPYIPPQPGNPYYPSSGGGSPQSPYIPQQPGNPYYPSSGGGSPVATAAPCDVALLCLMERTGYDIVQENGQRKYGGPPPDWTGPTPPKGSEVFVGKIPRDLFEDELVPVFEAVGRIYEVRLMMDFSGTNRGYAFVMFTSPVEASLAVRRLNNHEIRRGRFIGVVKSVDNCRLFVGGLPKNKSRREVLDEMTKVTEGVRDVIIYSSVIDKSKSRGFAFVEYDSHKAAAMARRKLIPGRIQLWGQNIAVDWALPEPDVDEDIMSKVTVLYVRNLLLSTTEEQIREEFNAVTDGAVDRVKKLRDFAFVHFSSRHKARVALETLHDTELDGSVVEVTWAKPADKARQDRTRFGQHVLLPDVTSVSPPDSVVRGAVRSPSKQKGRRIPPSTGSPVNPAPPQEMLHELCVRYKWGVPQYQLHVTNQTGSANQLAGQLYLCKVTIPSLPSQYNTFQGVRLSGDLEESRSLAAETALYQLGITADTTTGVDVLSPSTRPHLLARPLPSPTGGYGSPISSPTGYQFIYSPVVMGKMITAFEQHGLYDNPYTRQCQGRHATATY